MEINVVNVVFRNNSKPYTFNSYEFGIKTGEKVIVETSQGLELAIAATDSKKEEIENINLICS